jgi:glycosyltransferase involved in cell wall biosynthesis
VTDATAQPVEAGPRDPLQRILVLVPHEPELDPRIGWSLSLCRELARTDVIATVWNSTKPAREYDGVVAVERIEAMVYARPFVVRASALVQRLGNMRPAVAFVDAAGKRERGGRRWFRHHLGAAMRFAAAWAYYAVIISALARRMRTLSVPPKLVLCHDLYALLAAVPLAKRYRARLVYDSHEYFPESDLLAPEWQRWLTRRIEGRAIRHADAVIAVSPQLAQEMALRYRLRKVVAVPNAEPFPEDAPPPTAYSPAEPVRFLLQWQASLGRGIERLFDFWGRLEDDRAHLLVRIPDGVYPRQLRESYADLFASTRAQWLETVSEHELVSAARSAHVGVIPYVGPSKNHLFASPNKLSQYMLAGLAILSTDLPFIASLLDEFSCGVTYDPDDFESFRNAVSRLVDRPETLQSMRKHAFAASRERFNWQHVGREYSTVLREALAE